MRKRARNPQPHESRTTRRAALGIKVVFTGPAGTYNLDDLAKLRRASGLEKYIHECAQAVLVDAIARRGFFAVKRTRRSKAGA